MKTKTVKNGHIIRKICVSCGQLLPKAKLAKNDTPDIRKIKRIMKKNKLTQIALSKIFGVSQSCVSSWFNAKANKSGKINKKYFDILKSKGFL